MTEKEKKDEIIKAKFKIGTARREKSAFSKVLIIKVLNDIHVSQGKEARAKLIEELGLEDLVG
jgi:hypothetical protein